MVRKIYSWLSALALLALMIVPTTAQESTIVEIASESDDFNTLVAAVEAAGLVEALNGEGPFTVFAPTDDAFTVALDALGLTADELLADTETLTTVLTYHVVEGAVFSEDLSAGDVPTLQGEAVTINLDDGVMVNDATVVTPDVEASNGVIHVIDAVLLPPSMTDSSDDDMEMTEEPMAEATEEIADVEATEEPMAEATEEPMAEATEEMADMEATEEPMAEATEEMADVEATEEPMTEESMMDEAMAYVRVGHFSPDTPAVDVYVDGEAAIEALEYPNATDIIALPSGEYEIAVAPAGTSIDEAAIGPVTLTFDAETLTTVAAIGSLEAGTLSTTVLAQELAALAVGNAQVTVLHAIEGAPAVDVLTGDTTLVPELAYPSADDDNDGFFTLEEVATGMYDLSVAVSESGDELLSLPETDLADDTFYLVVAVGTPDDPAVQVFTATETDLGVAPGNLADVAAEAGNFETLLAAIDAAGLSDALATGGPFTIFAPTDEAFATALDALGLTAEELLADTDLLTTILEYHSIDGEVPAAQVVELEQATTLLGEPVSISVDGDTVTLNESVTVTAVDIEASNGIIHVIDAVLLPPSLTDSE